MLQITEALNELSLWRQGFIRYDNILNRTVVIVSYFAMIGEKRMRMKRNRKLLTAILFMLPLFAHALACGMVAPGIQPEVNEAVRHYSAEHNNTAVWLLVEKEGRQYRSAAGLADRERNITATYDQLFEIGSASKVFTGVAIFQLIEEGKLSLETKLSRFYKSGEITRLANFKGKNYWADVTVGMLLRHRSGFIDYLNVYSDDAKAMKLLGGREKHYTFDQLIHLAAVHGDANFKPGEMFLYCNTGYIILGDIITKVSGMEWHDYIRKNVMDKADMKHTWFGSQLSETEWAFMPRGYAGGKPTFMPPTLAGSAGEIVSNLDDLARFIKAWGEGRLYKKRETLKFQMTEGFVPMSPDISNLSYGYALMRIDGFYGHGGQTFGFESYIAYSPEKKEVYIVGINDAFVHSMELFLKMSGVELQQAKGY